jgi:hypothetical protein
MRRHRRLRSTTAPPATITESPGGANGPDDDASAAAMEAMGDPGDSGQMPRSRGERPRRE